jgi:hypothetical protein
MFNGADYTDANKWMEGSAGLIKRRVLQILQKFRSHLKILDARRMTWSELHTRDQIMPGATVR